MGKAAMTNQEFKQGDIVIAESVKDYEYHLTEGNPYIVIEHRQRVAPDFCSMIVVKGDTGRKITAGAHRFRLA